MATARRSLRCVLLNAARLDFDGKICFDALARASGLALARHEAMRSPEAAVEAARGHDVIINKEMPLPKEVINALDGVKLICEAGTGYNNIDLEAAHARGIVVTNVPTYATEAMAHQAITMVMALSCSLVQQQRALQAGDRTHMMDCHLGSMAHFELTGKTIGLVGGLGTIGSRVAAMAGALGMRVLASSRTAPAGPHVLQSRATDAAQSASVEVEVEVCPMDDLLSRSDFVSIHCPLNRNTRGLIDAAALQKMKPTAYLINTARGSIVDEAALVDALRSRSIAGAALDVYGEGSAPPPALPAASPLWSLENVILTPHIGWQRIETRQRVVDSIAETVDIFAQGKVPPCVVE